MSHIVRSGTILVLVAMFSNGCGRNTSPSEKAFQKNENVEAKAKDEGTAEQSRTIPLFSGDHILELNLETDFEAINSVKKPQEFPAKLTIKGEQTPYDLTVAPRGISRFAGCRFRPLKMNFGKRNSNLGIFSNVKEAKVVTHCEPNEFLFKNTLPTKNDQNVIHEYLRYKIFNIISDTSYRVRLVRFTYLPSSRSFRKSTHFAFFIEDTSDLKNRIGSSRVKEGPAEHHLKMVLFQVMIGNPDWNLFEWNVKKIGLKDGSNYFVPYDLDYSILNREPEFKMIKGGLGVSLGCFNEDNFQAAREIFSNKKHEILALYKNQSLLSESERKRLTKILNGFYAALADGSIFIKMSAPVCLP